ncbi:MULTISPECIES: bifunctional (p)ppGpp synthetase/guanosine-3',5'-bis(diphosphate) 3'-pyrophosphohydrolase [unclassified Luteimonas]|uniref:RelA/SpoT family protein n=1 Tax=unclassified Luteimonas TaxID=2629088 RepID=UPI001600A5CF|nr:MULTISPECIES: bifunctional (p)ppGpp synthetase/guanosine-3',5'-bis(diphosphate) 3'-pyrophosphohydrolase [unclassified Luteimonas]MBB1473688.1 bifunctional (p)ppGpp synthetase/guanosine-3',5'-bis(diphosphate) 3'-pyrophosphohydrolase [Luteimonas sp. MC1782]MBB6600097.1 bifunctional (p)ppGpp synthetase/guanosine-3',5'-bis(diphosphate) 3'-pyrophosphohydrolase [Luteimonas sp. MC1825]QOC87795.1 bifunctional (p)ppGpp synthetase/guanosine-3',5'-bis(diphosphate) 3'-pyrophosphohydrolase [Luteimonas sp.
MTSAELALVQVPVPGDEDIPGYMRALERASAYLPEDQRRQVRRAWAVGAAAHAGQVRKSGEPYITHPVAVAQVLAEQKVDLETLVAAILHDTIEDTPLGRDALAGEFGEAVAELVDGVTKLDKLQFANRREADAESFRKMMLAMARDLRVILIKLADRLHNMRTLGAQSPEARQRIASETLEIYAPIAQRLGMNLIKAELQDLGFAALHPLRHRILEKRIRSQPLVRREALAKIEAQLAQRLTNEGVDYRLVSRVKSPWSIYNKMRAEGKTFSQVIDVFGFRVIVGSVRDCYHALGVAHSVYKPLDGRFRDFIAIPKANGYQSLHTVLFGPYGSPIEVQIRTEEMDLIAERGIAAHWAYKHGGGAPNSAQARAHSWISALLESQSGTGSSLEFLENVKVDLFPDEVYLFTPKGDIMSLPRNATALDFAFSVHTDVGNRAVAARVDRKLVPLRTKLATGQSVEIVTAKSSQPRPQWLEFVVTGKARTAIRQQLKQLEHEDAVQLGHRMLDSALEDLDSSLEQLPAEHLEAYLAEHRFPRLEALLAEVALGNRMPSQVAQSLARKTPGADGAPRVHRGDDRILITGSERGVVTFANCCMPIPGDEIMGYHTAGRGIVVHRMECPNVAEYRKSPDRWVDIGWDREVAGDYAVALRIEVENRPGVLAQVAAAIAQADSNIDGVEYLERDTNVAAIRFSIEVRNRTHLAHVIRRTRRLGVVHGVQRI